MSGAIPLLPQYASMAWCSVKAQEIVHSRDFCTFSKLFPVACSESELTSESVNLLRYFGLIPRTEKVFRTKTRTSIVRS
jgi:hypothetical protein